MVFFGEFLEEKFHRCRKASFVGVRSLELLIRAPVSVPLPS